MDLETPNVEQAGFLLLNVPLADIPVDTKPSSTTFTCERQGFCVTNDHCAVQSRPRLGLLITQIN